MIHVIPSSVLFGATATTKETGPPSRARWLRRLWNREKQEQDGRGMGRKKEMVTGR